MDKTVLCYIESNHQFLMLFRNKKTHDMNKNKWIGIGGGIEPGETPETALIREVREETGLLLTKYEYRGELVFKNNDFEEIMYLYKGLEFEGELIECNEGELHWVDIDKVLDLNLWEGDRYFLPLFINSNDFLKIELIYKDDQLVQINDLSKKG